MTKNDSEGPKENKISTKEVLTPKVWSTGPEKGNSSSDNFFEKYMSY